MSSQQIYVSIDLGEETLKVGKLWFHQRGARPKASVRDKDGHLAIAKFPKKDDEFNFGDALFSPR